MAERIEGMSIGLDLDSIALERGLTGVKDRLRTVNSEMKKNMSAFDHSDRSIQKYETRLQGLNKKLDVQRKVTEETYKEYQKMVREHGEGSKQAEKAERAYNNQAAALNNLERYVSKATEELEEMRKEQAFLESGWGKLTTSLDNFSQKTLSIGGRLTDVGKTLSMRVTAPLVAAGGAALAAADQFDKAYRDIRVGTGATGQALKDLEKTFDDVFRSVPDSADKVANSIANLNTFTGFTGDVLEDLTKKTLDASRILGEDAVQASEEFGKTLKQWNIPAEEATGHLDHLFRLTQDYGVGLGQLNTMVSKHGSVMKNAGFELEEVAHFMASLESNGIQVTRVMPALNMATRNWAEEGKNAKEELQKMIDTIRDAKTDTEALAVATEVFGAQGAQRMVTAIRNDAIPSLKELGTTVEGTSGLIEQTTEETVTIGEEFARLKNTTITSLRPVGEILLNIAKDHIPPLIDGVTRLAEWFDDLSPKARNTGLAIAGIATVAGPATLVLGGMFNAVGRLAGGLSRLTGLLGRVGGAGLLGRIGMLGMAGPVGLAIAGITGLALVLRSTSKDTKRYEEVNLELAESLKEQQATMNSLVSEYDALRGSSFLTNEEFARLVDLQEEISRTTNESRLKELREEYEELRKKSGKSNEELDRMIQLNETLVEKVPEAANAISEQGNRIVDSTGYLKEYTNELQNATLRELERQLIIAQGNEKQLKKDIVELQKELNEGEEEEKRLKAEIKNFDEAAVESRLKEIDILMKEAEIGSARHIRLYAEKEELEGQLDVYRHQLGEQMKKNDEIRNTIAQKEAELGLDEEIHQMMVDQLLIQVGITAKKGEEVRAIDEAISKKKDEIKEQKELYDIGTITKQQYDEMTTSINAQIEELENVKAKMIEVDQYATGRTYNWDIYLTVQNLEEIESRIGRPIRKRVQLDVNQGLEYAPMYADGTPPGGHKGGLAVVGDGGGRELIALPSGQTLLSPNRDTLINLPKGSHVIPHRETSRLLSMTPKYATGTSGWRGLVDNLRHSEFAKLLALVGKSLEGSVSGTNQVNNQTVNNNEGNIYIDQLIIDAKSIQEFNDVVEWFKKLRQTARANGIIIR
ncbi:phage tail tape measure protein [Bacillaceae bacterium W0354]